MTTALAFFRHQVQHMQFAARGRQQPSEVADALEVSDAHGATVKCDAPVVAFAAKDILLRSALPRRRLDSVENRAGSPLLQVGLLHAASTAQGLRKAEARDRRLVGRTDLRPRLRRL